MKRDLWPMRDSVKDYFPLPKEIFSLGLSAAEIAIYAYLWFRLLNTIGAKLNSRLSRVSGTFR